MQYIFLHFQQITLVPRNYTLCIRGGAQKISIFLVGREKKASSGGFPGEIEGGESKEWREPDESAWTSGVVRWNRTLQEIFPIFELPGPQRIFPPPGHHQQI
jgi:hypothetical protein